MKKILFLIFILLGTINAFAENPLRLKSGTLLPLKSKGGEICCIFDFSKTRANRKPLEQYIVEDMNSDMETFRRYKPEMLQWFCEKWDEEIEDGPHAISEGNAKFRLNVVVRTMQLGTKHGWGGASISGYAEFYNQNETDPFAVVEILKMHGTQFGGAVSGYVGAKQVFNDLAEYLCDLIYHSK